MDPLADLNVIDLTHVMAGLICTLMFAAMGADVIKIEKTPDGDDTRRAVPPTTVTRRPVRPDRTLERGSSL
jgi:crotonobetainyl-CoA:carnitine CoA-transferase CaiB-like acyl-CoA transferase